MPQQHTIDTVLSKCPADRSKLIQALWPSPCAERLVPQAHSTSAAQPTCPGGRHRGRLQPAELPGEQLGTKLPRVEILTHAREQERPAS